MSTTSHISTSGGLISTAFVENIRQAQTNQRGTQPDTFALPGEDAPKSPAVLEATIAETWEALLERWDAIATELPHMDISQARDRWMLPLLRALDFQPGYQRSDIVLDESEALRFNISHFGWEKTGDRGSGLGVGEKDEARTPNPEPPPMGIVFNRQDAKSAKKNKKLKKTWRSLRLCGVIFQWNGRN
jgi:hypothetical protein